MSYGQVRLFASDLLPTNYTNTNGCSSVCLFLFFCPFHYSYHFKMNPIFIFRFQEINDVEESFRLFGTIMLFWSNPCLIQQSGKLDWQIRGSLLLEPDKFWFPDMVHSNSLRDSNLLSGNYQQKLMLTNNSGVIRFTGLIVGEFITSCDMDFHKFPFDE